jgi:hypothetical protein
LTVPRLRQAPSLARPMTRTTRWWTNRTRLPQPGTRVRDCSFPTNRHFCCRRRGDRVLEVQRKPGPSGEVHAARSGVARFAELVGATRPAGYAR